MTDIPKTQARRFPTGYHPKGLPFGSAVNFHKWFQLFQESRTIQEQIMWLKDAAGILLRSYGGDQSARFVEVLVDCADPRNYYPGEAKALDKSDKRLLHAAVEILLVEFLDKEPARDEDEEFERGREVIPWMVPIAANPSLLPVLLELLIELSGTEPFGINRENLKMFAGYCRQAYLVHRGDVYDYRTDYQGLGELVRDNLGLFYEMVFSWGLEEILLSDIDCSEEVRDVLFWLIYEPYCQLKDKTGDEKQDRSEEEAAQAASAKHPRPDLFAFLLCSDMRAQMAMQLILANALILAREARPEEDKEAELRLAELQRGMRERAEKLRSMLADFRPIRGYGVLD